MAGQKGRDVLIRIDDGAGAFETLAGIRTSELELGSERVDATSADSPGAWRELLAGAGVRTARIVGSGVFKDAASDARMRSMFFAGENPVFRFIVPGLGTLTGPFRIAQLKWGGTHDGEATFAIALESAGEIAFEVA